jgi:hypothetical protein
MAAWWSPSAVSISARWPSAGAYAGTRRRLASSQVRAAGRLPSPYHVRPRRKSRQARGKGEVPRYRLRVSANRRSASATSPRSA